jgi:hypothetical protein
VKKTCDDARCLDRNIESWRALETTKAVALSSLARVLAAKEQLAAKDKLGSDKEARHLLYQAIACEPHLVDAYLQLARLYRRRQGDFAKDWRDRANSLQARAKEMNPACSFHEAAIRPAKRRPSALDSSAWAFAAIIRMSGPNVIR